MQPMNPEAEAALARVTALAHRLAAGLAGEKQPADGLVETPGATALASAMLYFLTRIDADDLQALFFADGSMKDFTFRPDPEGRRIPALLADLL